MKKILVFVIAIVILILIVGGFVYITNESKLSSKPDMIEFIIDAIDAASGEQQSTHFKVFCNGEELYDGFVRNDSAEKIQIRKCPSLSFYNYGAPFYTSSLIVYPGKNTNASSETLELHRYGDINVENNENLVDGENNITIYVSTKDNIKKMHVCVVWSYNILDVNLFNNNTPFKFSEVKPPQRLKNKVNKCYKTGWTLSHDSMNFIVQYKTLNLLTEEDYIKLIIIDSNLNYNDDLVIEDSEGNDVCLEDYEFLIIK